MEEITKKEIIAFISIVLVMISSLVYGLLIMKKSNPTPSPTPTNCWQQYQDQGEDVAIRMCEGTD
jgi:hypothetical protein